MNVQQLGSNATHTVISKLEMENAMRFRFYSINGAHKTSGISVSLIQFKRCTNDSNFSSSTISFDDETIKKFFKQLIKTINAI